MKNKLFALLAAALLALLSLTPGLAGAEARFPSLRGPLTDDANALSESVASDIAEFQTLAADQTDVTPYVAIVHFLDGLDAQTYAAELFKRWGLGDDDFLLLGAVAEDSFASVSGKNVLRNFSDQNAKNLLASSRFSEMFKAQQYDAAFGNYFVAFADMLSKQYGTEVRLGQVFADYQTRIQPTPKPTGTQNQWTAAVSEMWDGFNDRFASSARDYDSYHEQRERESKGLGPAGWIILALLALIIFGQSDPVRRARRNGCAGCGCSPIGWVFSILGLGALFGRWRK